MPRKGNNMIDFERLKEDILLTGTQYLEKDRSGKGYICPVCNSGNGNKGTGITTKDGKHYTCWTGCFSSADIIDIIGIKYGLTEYRDKLTKAAEELGLNMNDYQTEGQKRAYYGRTTTSRPQPQGGQTMTGTKEQPQAEKVDYTDFFVEANKHIMETEYHRGISKDTLDKFCIGYVEKWRHPKASDKVPTSPRLIIPTSEYSYLARDTRKEIPPQAQQYSKQKVGATPIFYLEGMYDNSGLPACVVVEGEIDCMSVIDLGYFSSIGLGTVGNKGHLIEAIKAKPPTLPLVLALDNDTAGQQATAYLREQLDKLHIPYSLFNWEAVKQEGTKTDINDLFIKDRDRLTDLLFNAAQKAQDRQDEIKKEIELERAAQLEELHKESTANYIDLFRAEVRASEQANYYPTGFEEVDRLLDGGLYAGLYIVGAISSLGKTTFCLQVAEQIAKAGNDVLIFSLEMARSELMAKGISRNTYQLAKDKTQAKTTRGILTGSRYRYYSQEEKALIDRAIEEYSTAAQHIYISEGVGNIGVSDIRQKVINHTELTGKAPVVLIDYLQILAPADIRATDKQNTDKAVLELKRMSRDYNIPVIGISSFNRDNYNEPVSMASYKESGSLEYSSDLLIGLQFVGMDYRSGESEKDRKKRIRELFQEQIAKGRNGEPQDIQLKILKNRNGAKGETMLHFYPMFNYFEEPAIPGEEQENIDNPFL